MLETCRVLFVIRGYCSVQEFLRQNADAYLQYTDKTSYPYIICIIERVVAVPYN